MIAIKVFKMLFFAMAFTAAGFSMAEETFVSVSTDRVGVQHTLDSAFDAYEQAQSITERESRMEMFKRAQHLFTRVAKAGDVTASLWVNIGTAALQAENLGAAVLAFRRALLIDPNSAQAQQNLKHARTLLPSSVPTPSSESMLGSFFFWHKLMTVTQQAGLASVCFLTAALGFAISIRWNSSLARNLSYFPLVLWGGLLISVTMQLNSSYQKSAVLIADETIARAADSANAPMRFSQPLPGGTEVKVIAMRDSWAKIGLANGRDAWVHGSSMELVDP